MKRLIMAMLSIMAVMFMAATAQASLSVSLVPSTPNVAPGSTVKVSVDISDSPAFIMTAISAVILYDPSVFTYVDPSVVRGAFLTDNWGFLAAASTPGKLRVGAFDNTDFNGEGLATGSGTLFTFTLLANADAPLGPSALNWGDAGNGVGFDYGDADWLDVVPPSYGTSINVGVPTAITLASFDVKPGNNKVTLIWTTGDETDNLGFNIYRADSKDGEYVKINASLIASKVGSGLGTSYEFTDSDVKNRTTYFYKLEDVDVNGVKTMHGPVSAMPRFIFRIFGK